jgi:phosphatidate cytidylyltransferase
MLRDRARSAALLVPALLLILWLGNPWISVAVGLAVAIGAREAFRLIEAAGHQAFPGVGIVLAVVVALSSVIPGVPDRSGTLLLGVGIVLVGITALGRTDPRDGLMGFAMTVFGALYVGLLGFMLQLVVEPPAIAASAPLAGLGPERAWLLVLLLCVWSFDTGAYLVGRRLGRRPFMAHISPAKTVEGVIGGALTVTVVAVILLVLLGRPWPAGLLLGPVIAVTAQAGDLAESMLKRAAGAKDSGRLIPGHGGMLDRLDSFLFAAPAMVLVVRVALA